MGPNERSFDSMCSICIDYAISTKWCRRMGWDGTMSPCHHNTPAIALICHINIIFPSQCYSIANQTHSCDVMLGYNNQWSCASSFTSYTHFCIDYSTRTIHPPLSSSSRHTSACIHTSMLPSLHPSFITSSNSKCSIVPLVVQLQC